MGEDETKGPRRSNRGDKWFSRDTERLESEGRGAFVKKALSDVVTGQDAAETVEAPAFEAATAGLLDQPIIVVSQDPKLIEVSDEYRYLLADGTPVAIGRQVNQGLGRKLIRITTSLDSKMKSVVEVTQDGQPVFTMTRTGAVGKNTMAIADAAGSAIGDVKQTKRGRRRATFELVSHGSVLASAQTGEAHAGRGYDIITPDGETVAYVRSTHRGVASGIGTSRFSAADDYVLRFERRLEDPLRTLVVAMPMSVDSAVSQRDDGMELGDVTRTVRRLLR